MRDCRKLFSCVFMLVLFAPQPTASASQWTTYFEPDDFGGQDVGTALVLSEKRKLALRCQAGQPPILMFATREKWLEAVRHIYVKLLFRIDNGEVERLNATTGIHTRHLGDKEIPSIMVFVKGARIFPLLQKIANAKSRIAVAFEWGGKAYEKARFAPTGSKAAFQRIWKYCGSAQGVR